MYKEHDDLFNEKYENDVINKMCHTDIYYFMNGLNQHSDRSSMACSIELRVPFIDKEVIENEN